MVYDRARARIVLFGGAMQGGAVEVVGDTWVRDADGWRELPRSGDVPGPRTGASLVYDSVRERVVLFGGVTAGRLYDDTWELDGDTWIQIDTPNAPPARVWAGTAFDPGRGVVVLFAGSVVREGSDPADFPVHRPDRVDTWEYDGSDWRQIETEHFPRSRLGPSMVYDPVGERIVLFGGFAPESAFIDTWEYDGTDWNDLTADPTPRGRFSGGLVYAANSGSALLFGGGTAPLNDVVGDTWLFGGAVWGEVIGGEQPPARMLQGMAYDIDRGRVVLFGGQDFSGQNIFDDTWELEY